MKEFILKYDDGETAKITGTNEYQEIEYTAKGRAYVTVNHFKLLIDDFISLFGEFKKESEFLGVPIQASYCDTTFSGFLLHVSDDGDMAKVFYLVHQ